MKSFLLQQLARLILPFAVLFGLALLLKGHDAPGGGFVAGLSMAVAGILGFTAYGARRFRSLLPFEPERVAVLGGLVVMVSLMLPTLGGDAALTQWNGEVEVGPFVWKWTMALLFEAGVVMIVGGGLSAAALWLWEPPTETSEGD